jgi:hypothetical protein
MIWHFHDFGKWEDVKLGEKAKSAPGIPVYILRQTITQQRRCCVCNLVQTRYSA